MAQAKPSNAITILNEQLRVLKRIRLCAEIWSLIGVLMLLAWGLVCIAMVLGMFSLPGLGR